MEESPKVAGFFPLRGLTKILVKEAQILMDPHN